MKQFYMEIQYYFQGPYVLELESTILTANHYHTIYIRKKKSQMKAFAAVQLH